MIPVKNKDNKEEVRLTSNSYFAKIIRSTIKEIVFYEAGSLGFTEAEMLIKDSYARKYGAKINVSYPKIHKLLIVKFTP